MCCYIRLSIYFLFLSYHHLDIALRALMPCVPIAYYSPWSSFLLSCVLTTWLSLTYSVIIFTLTKGTRSRFPAPQCLFIHWGVSPITLTLLFVYSFIVVYLLFYFSGILLNILVFIHPLRFYLLFYFSVLIPVSLHLARTCAVNVWNQKKSP